MRPSQSRALVAVVSALGGIDVRVGGSALLALNGASVEPRDVDLMVSSERRDDIAGRLGAWLGGFVEPKPHPHLDSAWVADLVVEGEPVEIMGGLAVVSEGVWWELPMRPGRVVEIEGVEVVLAAAGPWVVLYTLYRPERAYELARVVDREERERTIGELPPGIGIQWPSGNVIA